MRSDKRQRTPAGAGDAIPRSRGEGRLAAASLVPGIPNWLLRAGLLANAFLGLLLGLTMLLPTMVILGPVQATDSAKMVPDFIGDYVPEREMMLYVLGCAVGALLALGLACTWQWRLRKHEEGLRQRWAAATVTYVLLFSVALVAWSTSYLCETANLLLVPPVPGVLHVLSVLAVPQLLVLALAVFVFFAPIGTSAAPHGRRSVWDYAMPVVVFALLYVPDCVLLAGYSFQQEGCHHLDFYAMAPTLAFSHGKALGTEFFSQYGVGWPMVFAALRPILSISYAHMLNVFILYGCVYFCGVYFLLRLLTRSGVWAAFGTALCILLEVFHGTDAAPWPIWLFPSSTVIRSTMDIWCFLCLYLFADSGRWRWAAGAAAASALGVVFETDTGIYLAVALTAVLLACFWLRDAQGNRVVGPPRIFLWNCLMVAGVWLAVVLAMLVIASRGTLVSMAFWRGWLEALLAYGSGISSIPMKETPLTSVQGFLFVLLLLTGMVAWCGIELATSRGNARVLVFGGIALYGLATQLLYVNRTHPYNLYHSIVPCGLAGVGLGFEAYRRLQDKLHGDLGALPALLVIGLVPLYFVQPQVRVYPNAIAWATNLGKPAARTVDVAIPGVKIVPSPQDADIAGVRAVVEWLKSHAANGAEVAIFDKAGTYYHAAAGTCPWYRYSPLFAQIIFRAQVDDAGRYFASHPPAFALIHPKREEPFYLWDFFHPLLEKNLAHVADVAGFEVWGPKQ
jgi:hypothetical protein